MEKIKTDKSIRILIADDNANDVQLAQEEIKKTYRSSVFKIIDNSANLIHELKTFRPDIILSEYSCERINVLDIISNAAEHSVQIPVIIFTDSKNEECAINFIIEGAFDYVLKSNKKRLCCAVTKAIREKSLRLKLALSEIDLAEYEKYIKKYKGWESNIPGTVYQFVLHPDGRNSFVYLSSASRTMFGMEPEQLVEDLKLMMDLVHPEDLKGIYDAVENSAVTLKTFKHEARFIINGDIKWYRFISRPELQKNGDITWDGFIMDNTENKHLEEELAEEKLQIQTLITTLQGCGNYPANSSGSGQNNFKNNKKDIINSDSPFLADAVFDQNQFKILMDNLPDAIYFKDLESRFIRVNKHFIQKVCEYSENGVRGKTDFDFFDEAHADNAIKDEQEIIKTGVPVINKIEKEVWPSGKVTWVSTTKMALRADNGIIIGTFGMSRDITNFKQMEEAYAQERNLLREIIDSIPDRIYVKDTDGNFMLNNFAEMNAYGINTSGRNKRKKRILFYSRGVCRSNT